MILRRASRTDPRLVLGSALAFVLPLGANLAALAQDSSAQAPATQVPSPQVPSPVRASVAARARRQNPISTCSSSTTRSSTPRAPSSARPEAQTKLKLEIEALGDDRRALNQQLIDTAAARPRRRDQDRGDAGAPASARRTGTDFQEIARRAPHGDRRNSRRPAAHRPAAAAGAPGAAGRRAASGAHRDHARRRGAGDARRRPTRSPAISPTCCACARTSSPNTPSSRATSTSSRTSNCASTC